MYACNQLKYTEDVYALNTNLLHHFSFYLYSVQISNFVTWSGFNFKTNVEVVLFKWEILNKTIWWLSVIYIAWGNHLGSLSYRQLQCSVNVLWDAIVPHSSTPTSIDRSFCTSKIIVFRNTSVLFLNISNKWQS